MPYAHYERLSALDATFLAVESPTTPMHVGAVAVFDAGPLATPEGGVDFDRIRRVAEATLHRMPRYRQRLAWIPVFEHPVWVDEPRFNLHYHLRHTSLPTPGDAVQLKRLAGRIFSQPLDRGKPLWEMWVVEGLEGGRFALITKAHHCMIDGVGSAELMASAMSPRPDAPVPEPPRWIPRPAPSGARLFADELAHRAASGGRVAGALRSALASPREAAEAAKERLLGLGEAFAAGIVPASPTPFNVELGPHRRFDWLRMDLEAVREVKARLGGTVNDVALATATGALRRFLEQRAAEPERLDFRAMIPVNVRSAADARTPGNRITMMVARLPVSAQTPRERLRRVTELTAELKASHQAQGVETLEEVSDWTTTTLMARFARLTAQTRAYNVTITNVPGPPFEAYLLGAPLREVYPLVPLYRSQALGIALFSYFGGLFWGLNADWDALPDLHDLAEMLAEEFEALRKAASG